MSSGICQVSIAPVRKSATDQDEIVTQLLFGEQVEILEIRKNWSFIRCLWDDYVGWCDTKQILPISDASLNEMSLSNYHAYDLVQPIVNANFFMPITMGATLPSYDGLVLKIENQDFTYNGQVIDSNKVESTPELAVKIARRYLFAPYLWGGRSPFGIDCSGLTQMIYKLIGIRLLRDASQQVTQGRLIDFAQQMQAGDLAFFENEKGKIAHVGMIFPDYQIIHAHGIVRIDRIDHFGIFNEKTQKYTHKLRIIKRFMDDLPLEFQMPLAIPNEIEIENQIKLF